jgi:hypothetical protein
MAPLTEGVITHEDGCPDSAPAIRAQERERIRQQLTDEARSGKWDDRGGGVTLHRVADLIGDADD